jgi:gluconolactonase
MPHGHAPLEVLATGFGLVEGPRVDAAGRLYFSDALKGGVYRRGADGAIETIVPKRRGVGGIALHADGGIVISGRDISHVKDGSSRIVFALDGVPGFNDLFTDAHGNILVGSHGSTTTWR